VHPEFANPGSSLVAGRLAAAARGLFKAVAVVLAIHAIGLADGRADNAIKQADISALSGNGGYGGHRALRGTKAGSEVTHHGSAPLDGTLAVDIPVWRTIALGVPNNLHAFRAALKKGCRIGRLANQILDRTAIGKSRTQVDLVILSAADLGFTGKAAPRAAIYRRAHALGLELCPAEVGPQLRLQYPNQEPGELLHIAMEPIATRRQERVAFVVGHGGDRLLLVGSAVGPQHMVYSDLRFVFCSL
jgi:hypothetical protein